MYTFFFFQVTQFGIEPGHPRTLFPDNVIRKIIGHVGSQIYDINEVLITSSVKLVTQYPYKMYTFFFFQVTQPGIMDFIYIIYRLTNVTVDVRDDIFLIQGVRMPWFDISLGHLKKEKKVYILFMCYISYILYI